MFLQSLFDQADYLRRQESGSELERIEKALTVSLKQVHERMTLPQGLTSCVSMALCYAAFRHLHWINTPIFRDVLIHHIATDFRIESSAASLLTDAVLREVRAVKTLQPSHVDNSDFEFLKYVFIMAATAENERSLVSDMGLGPDIIYKMKSTLKMVMTDPESCEKGPASFLSELDAQIYEIMIDVSRDIRRYAWSIHVERLRFLMIGAGDPLASLITRYGAKWIFETLLSIGTKNIVSSSQIAARLQRNFIAAEPAVAEAEISTILGQLHELKLIFPVGGSRHNTDNYKWELANEAARVTADAFAVTWMNATNRPFTGFRELNQFYQKSLIQCLNETHVKEVRNMIQASPGLAPEVLTAALKYLAKNEPAEDFRQFVRGFRAAKDSIWTSRSVQRAISDLNFDIEG